MTWTKRETVTGRIDEYDDLDARILLAALDLDAAGEPLTFEAIGDRVGVVKSTVFHRMSRMKKDGWVDWEMRRKGTLHPTCRVVAQG